MNGAKLSFSITIAAVVVMGACTLATNGTQDVPGTSSSSTSTSATSTTGAGGDIGVGGAASSSAQGSGGMGGAGGSASASSSSSDASSSSAEASSSSSGGGTLPTVQCGNADCQPGEVCCTQQSGKKNSPNPISQSCTSSIGCTNTIVPCDGPEDCPAPTKCCGNFNFAMDKYNFIACGTCPLSNDYELCHPENGDADCPTGKQCFNEAFLGPGYGYCGP